MTNQEAFDRMVAHLRKQGGQSLYGAYCAYRSTSGARCAVGVLLTDEFYQPQFEGMGVWHETMQEVIHRALPGVDIELLAAMQRVHDAYMPTLWEREWEDVACRFGLAVPVGDSIVTVKEEEVMSAVSSAGE